MTKDYKKDYKKCVVAFLDILGFKEMVTKRDFDDIFTLFNLIITENEARKALSKDIQDYEAKEKRITALNIKQYNESLDSAIIDVMSDSIVVATPDESPESLAVVIDICDFIQRQMFYLDKPVLLRGAISIGQFYYNGKIAFGQGLVDAYLAQERYAIYPRVIVSNDVVNGHVVSIDPDYRLPEDLDKYFRIDSIERFLNISKAQSWNEIESSKEYARLRNLIDSKLTSYSDDRVRQKYLWLNEVFFFIERRVRAKTEGKLLLK